jgi:N4-gp56 family major capsid protein
MSDYKTALTRGELNAGVLQTWLNRQVLENLEPELFFYAAGKKPDTPTGYNTVGWAKFSKVDETSVTIGTNADDGVTPEAIDFDATVITCTPAQHRVVISLADMTIELNVINFLAGAAKAIADAMARSIDKAIQTVIMAGTHVIYGGTAASRTALANTDILTAGKLTIASALLDARFAKKIGGYFVAYAHPYAIYDLRTETGTGNWLEVSKYAAPEKIFKGEIGMIAGIRMVMAPFIKPFSSTVTVYPTLVVGADAYGVSNFQALKSYVTPATPSDSDPLAQRRKVGSKVAFATTILEQDNMIRIETGVTASTWNIV